MKILLFKMDDFLLEDSWSERLQNEFSKTYFKNLQLKLRQEKASGASILPDNNLVFNALNSCFFENVRVIILGQDPYHNLGQAHGLSFSVPDGLAIPPSLRNIFKEIQSDLKSTIPASGNLQYWAEQGVLLLNTILTVSANEPGSHRNYGWANFTDQIIHMLSTERSGLVFLLWGNFAHKKAALIDQGKHLVLKAAHPSPLSAYKGFFGCKHFSKTNAYLSKNGQKAIRW